MAIDITSAESREAARAPSEAPAAPPAWLQTLFADYTSAVSSAFVLHGSGVFDYVQHPSQNLNLREYLVRRLGRLFTVATFSPDEGITFDGPTDTAEAARERFVRVLTGTARQAPVDPEEAALLGGLEPEADQPLPNIELPSTASAALPMLVQFLESADGGEVGRDADGNRVVRGGDGSGQKACVIVDRLDLIAPPSDKGMTPDPRLTLLSLLHRAGTLPSIANSGALIIFLSPSLAEVHPDLRLASSGIRAIEIPPPDLGERAQFAEREVAKKGLSLEIGVADLARQTAGLYRRHVQDICLRAAARADKTLTQELVRERKREHLNTEYAEVLEVLDPIFSLDQVGGHELAKEYLRDEVVACLRDDDLLDYVPLGIAFLGPPGTGKTMLANALAAEIGFNCVLLRADKIRGGIVGESERKLAKALAGIEALAPAIVFIDEIDQKIARVTGGGGGGGDSVESNIFSRLLEFFGDAGHRGRILAVAASNRPDLVDAALFRPGRFDVKIPLLPPASGAERASVLAALIRRYGEAEVNPKRLAAIGAETDNWTQAELERLLVKARSIRRIRKVDLGDALVAAKARLKTSTREVETWSALAIAECDDLDLIPETYKRLGSPEAVEAAKERAAVERRRSAQPADGERRARSLDDL